MLKKIIVVSLVASIALLTVACSNSAEDACEKVNELCESQQGFQKSNCSESSDKYDKLSDAEKEKADKQADCIDDAKTCDDAIKCALAQ
ncbi:MAG: hypothetical protein KIT84_22880 [Labilithrix sp.]|nr:hypothetical protein [Labilithrix sp.]MCW5813891.1 hypothetical protein [Labilithrix sp.]